MKMARFLLLVALLASATLYAADRKPLRIYFVDVEGGQSTLFITPAGQSLLIDTGWPGHESRDAKRIASVAKAEGLSKIDYVLITHFHEDHVGGVPQLVEQIPVGTFVDHGINRETDNKDTVDGYSAYQKLLATGKYKHIVGKVGEKLPIKGMDVTFVSADGNLIAKPLPGAGQDNHDACAKTPKYPADTTENARSLGSLITFGKLRIVDLGDLTHDKEVELMCPVNKLGHVDVYIVSHHGWDHSGSPAFVDGIHPQVAIMDNGATKGGSPSVWDIIHNSGVEGLWQLHYSEEGADKHNSPPEFIANLKGPDGGHYFKLTAWPNGKYEIFNSRTGDTKKYQAR